MNPGADVAKMRITRITETDWPALAAIYQEGLDTGVASFETKAPDWSSWNAKYLPHSRFAVLEDDIHLGWAALAPASQREVYRGVAEVSVYVASVARGRGAGHLLMEKLVSSSESEGLWTLQSSIFPQNEASIRLHLRHGFRQLGRREKIAKRDGKWHDNLIFERRSTRII